MPCKRRYWIPAVFEDLKRQALFAHPALCP